MGPRRTILHRLASAITIHPAFDGRPRTLEPGSDLGNRDVAVNDELSNPQTSAWSQSCVSVGHKRAFLAVDIFASPTQPARPSPTSHARITILQPTSPVSTPRRAPTRPRPRVLAAPFRTRMQGVEGNRAERGRQPDEGQGGRASGRVPGAETSDSVTRRTRNTTGEMRTP